MDSYEAKSKALTTESSEKHDVGETKEITSPPDFRNILKRFEETKDIVKVEKIPSATDVLTPTVSPCKIGQVCESEAKNVNTSAEEVKASTANAEDAKKVDNAQPISEITTNVKDDRIDSNNKDQEISSKDSAEKNVGKPTTWVAWKPISVSKDSCSGNTEQLKKVDNTQPISEIPSNVKDDCIDLKNKDKEVSSKDSAEKDVGKPTTWVAWKPISVSKDSCSGNTEQLKKVDNTQPISEIPSNVKDDCIDLKNKDKEVSSKDSAEKDIGKATTGATWKFFSVSKDSCSHNTEVNTSDEIRISPKASTMKPVADSRESRAKVLLVGENVLHHPLSVIEDEETAEELVSEETREELLIDLGIEGIKYEVESGSSTSDLPNPPKKKLSLQELEQAFISALITSGDSDNKIDVQNIAKLVSKSVPAIKITDASEFENEKISSEFVEDTAAKAPTEILLETENSEASADVNVQSNSETPIDDCSYEGQSSIAQSTSLEFYEQVAVVTQAPKKDEAKPFFYISSSELPPELRHRTTAMSEESYTSQEPNDNRVSQSCLCSKDLHGMIFLIGSSVALLAFCVAALAHRGAIPAYYEVIGFSVSIISGIFGLLSFLCYTILTCYSACTAHGYQRLTDAESALPFNRGRQSGNFVEESWSSEKERAWRLQNGMSSTRTSEISVRSVSERQALISKTERIKKDVTELLDTFANMMTELEPVESIEMQALANEDEKKSDNLQESPPE